VIYALLWVDDLIMLDNCKNLRNEFVKFLQTERKYQLTDRGDLTYVLGISLQRDRVARTIQLGQELCVNTACKRFSSYLEQSNLRSFDVPAAAELANFSIADCPIEGSAEQLEMQPLRSVYLAMVGVLIWISSSTRPDVSVATAVLSRFSINPAKIHFAALVRVFIYLKGSASLTLTLGGRGDNAETLSIYTDSSHEEGPSLTGVLMAMGDAAIDWICRRQKSVMRSSTAAEAMANADGCDDGMFKKELMIDFGIKILSPIWFLSDSLSSVMLHKDFYTCTKSKHIARAIAVLRENIKKKVYEMVHIPGDDNYSDALTKPLPRAAFLKCRNAIMGAKVVRGAATPLTVESKARLALKYDRTDKT
jgi:hypothetical protein